MLIQAKAGPAIGSMLRYWLAKAAILYKHSENCF